MRKRFGRGWQTAAIGPAGERRVRYATSAEVATPGVAAWARSWVARTQGRVVRSATGQVPDPAAVMASARDLRARSFGPATAKYRELGTVANLLTFNAFPPSRPAISPRSPSTARTGSAEELHELHPVARRSCAACSIGCEHIYCRKGGGASAWNTRTSSLSGRCAGCRPGRRVRGGARCDGLGLDTISAGATIAWAMECTDAA